MSCAKKESPKRPLWPIWIHRRPFQPTPWPEHPKDNGSSPEISSFSRVFLCYISILFVDALHKYRSQEVRTWKLGCRKGRSLQGSCSTALILSLHLAVHNLKPCWGPYTAVRSLLYFSEGQKDGCGRVCIYCKPRD